jgi:hypothetical protein
MIIQMLQGSKRILARSPGKKRVPVLQIFQPLVIHSGSEVPPPGQGQTDSLHIFGEGTPVRMDEDRG